MAKPNPVTKAGKFTFKLYKIDGQREMKRLLITKSNGDGGLRFI